MRKIIVTLVAAVLSGLYWLGFFFVAEAFTVGDYRSGGQPAEWFVKAKIAVVLIGGPLLYAALIEGWRRGFDRILNRPAGR